NAPMMERAGFMVLRGNLFDFAIMKTSVISEEFRARYLSEPGRKDVFEGTAFVFDGSTDYHNRINDPALDIDMGEAGLLHKDALTVSGQTAWDQVKDVQNHNEDVIRPVEQALASHGGIAVLKGNLAPKGAVIKPSAASPHLLRHRGRAVVFEDIDDYKARINDEALDIDE
ncbi:dihydroxy-acid dehydratase, partial [Falsirhodobacter sp. alg1]|uniref:dihydroxy-acid dehydratase domain-containing protein n=1 Tax=Falsirhodobacter sp. alg1 TaxID=1472418 RepID=UPI00178CF6E7